MAAVVAPIAGWKLRLESWARPRRSEALPVALDRRRVYVLPTRFGLFFAALLGGMALGALNYNNNPALLLCLLLAGTAMASLLAAHLQLSGLTITAIDAEPVAAGQPLQLRLHAMADAGRSRIGLQLDDGRTTRGGLSLRNGQGTAQLAIPTQRRGWLQLPRLRIATVRPLGLARAWSYVWPSQPLLVYPAPEPDAPPLPSGQGDSQMARQQLHGDDVHQLRAYRRGDSRRSIAWKPSARQGHLLVREFEQPQGADVVLDWERLPATLPWEQRIRRLARWVDDAERQGRRYQLRLPGNNAIGPDTGAAHRHACLRALALLPAA